MRPYRVLLETITQPSSNYEWIPMDTLELFYNNLKKYPDNKTLRHYLENPIDYSLNNYGFRSPDDFNLDGEGNVFLGCSHTFGIGHYLENTWSYKLNEKIGGKFWNLSIPGTGVMTHYRILNEVRNDIKIKNIFHYVPRYLRYEFFIDHKPMAFAIAADSKEVKDMFGEFYETSLINDDQYNFTYDSYIMAIKGLANEIGCDYYHYSNEYFPHSKDVGVLAARDLVHLNVPNQNHLYLEFLKLYKTKQKFLI